MNKAYRIARFAQLRFYCTVKNTKEFQVLLRFITKIVNFLAKIL